MKKCCFPTNRYAFFVDYMFVCVLSYFEKRDGDIHEFLKNNRFDLARSKGVSWERIQIKLVEFVNGPAPFLLVGDSWTV